MARVYHSVHVARSAQPVSSIESTSRAAHSLTGVSLNIGAIGIVEELAAYREAAPLGEVSIEPFREAVAACLLVVDDLYDALVSEAQ